MKNGNVFKNIKQYFLLHLDLICVLNLKLVHIKYNYILLE